MDENDFMCPIGGEIMTDPVIAQDGHTYERKHIVEWFRVRLSSPLTNQNLTSAELTPNHTLKKIIADFLASRPGSIPKTCTAQQLVNERDIPEQELNQIRDYVYDHYHSTDEVILVKHVAKVNNPRLQASFDEYKQEIGGRVIRAFHGTLDESAASIAQQGFKCPLSNKREDIMQETGLLTFGKAIHFTQHSNLACAFGEATLVVSQVVLGNEWNLTTSRNDLDNHKVRARDKNSVACARTHEFAIYEPRQTLPLYVVTYKLVKPGTQGEAYDRVTLAATYSRMVDASSIDWELVQLHLGAQGRPRQRHAALRALGDCCRNDPTGMVPLLRVITQIFDDIKTRCLSLDVSEDDAPVLWLALRVCWNCALRDQRMQGFLVGKIGASTFVQLLSHWNDDVITRAAGCILNLSQSNKQAQASFWEANAPTKLVDLVKSKSRGLEARSRDRDESRAETVAHCLGALANLSFAHDSRQRFLGAPRLRSFLQEVAEPLMDSWSAEVSAEATRLFSCIISGGVAPSEWIEEGGCEVFQRSLELDAS